MFDLCPRCGSSAKPKQEGGLSTCPNCGFESRFDKEDTLGSILFSAAKAILIVFAAIVGLLLLVVAFIYAACVCNSKGGF